MMNQVLRAAVAVPTRNRGPKLERCLEHLSAQRYPDFRIIVADNASTDHTAELVRDFAARSPVPVEYLYEPRRGGAHGRNRALQLAADCDVVAFVDDDCFPEPDWLAALVREFADPAVGYAGGQLLLDDPTDAPFTITTRTERLVIPPGIWTDGDDVTGTGMAVRRAAVVAIGGYDTLLSPGTWFGAGEDMDMHSRLCGAGWVGVFTPDAITYHGHGRKPGDPELVRVKRVYQFSRGAWYAKRFTLGPKRWRSFRIAISEARNNPWHVTRGRIAGFLNYWRLALPRVLRRGVRGLHPDITVPTSTTAPS